MNLRPELCAMFYLNLLISALALGLFLPCAILMVECVSALLPARLCGRAIQDRTPRVAILTPAHNEEAVIAKTISSLLSSITSDIRILVIADNCTDNTVDIVRSAGIEVSERNDLMHKGKGFALDFGLSILEADPPDVVIVIDADCCVQKNTIHTLAQQAMQSNRPIQAVYLMDRPSNPSPTTNVSALAFLIKNLVRPLGLHRLGLPCQLTGTGMAFPWPVIQKISLASNNIVEDMQLGIDLAVAGHAPMFCENAKVNGQLPSSDASATSQRRRWEHGHLQTLLSQVPRLLISAIRLRKMELAAMALDLSVPPLALLVIVWSMTMATAMFFTLFLEVPWPIIALLALDGTIIATSVTIGWMRYGRSDLPLSALLAAPLYVLWKIPIYLTFLVRREKQWVRTERNTRC